MKKLLTLSFLSLLFTHQLAFSSPLTYGVYNFTDNKFIETSNIGQLHSIASITKLMTAYIFIKNMPATCMISITEEDRDTIKFTNSSKLPRNEKIPCFKLLNTMLVSSDNNAAFALSRSIPHLSRHDFINLMNKQAKDWNMHKTNFADPAGLDPRNISTVEDLIILVKNISTNPIMNYITSKQSTVFIQQNGKIIHLNNTNRLVRELDNKAKLSKTGFINESGYNLVYLPQNLCGGKQIGIVSLGDKSSILRSNFALSKLKHYGCFNNI